MIGYAISEDGTSWRMTDDKSEMLPGETWSEIEPVIQPSPKDIITKYEDAVEAEMDTVFQGWGYKDTERCIGYAASANPQWSAEAAKALEYRDKVWMWSQQQQTAIMANPALLPATTELFVAMMPAPPARPKV